MMCTIPSHRRRIIVIVLVHRCAKYFYKHLLNIGVQANQEKHLERRSYLISGDGGTLFQMSDMPREERSVEVYDLYHELAHYALLKRNANLSDKTSKLEVRGLNIQF